MSEVAPIDCLEGFAHPREGGRLIGHAGAEKEFLDSFNSGRFHHAWLVTGPKGVGKATFAYRAAKFLLSQGDGGGGLFGPPDSLDVAEDSTTLAQIRADAHPGLTVLRRRYDSKTSKYFSVIRVDDVRKLGNFFGLTASDGGWRVVIVDCVDDMNIAAANAFLKILEEPPVRTVFFLLSHTPAGLLQTIRSRCRMMPLKPLRETEVAEVIRANGIQASDQDIAMLANLAEGSPGKAISLMQSGGLDVFRAILDLFGRYPRFDPDRLHGLADLAGRKEGEGTYRIVCELFPWWLARMVRSVSVGFHGVSLIEGEQAVMENLAGQRPVDFWVEIWEKSNHLIERADSINLDRKQIVLNLFLNSVR
ncbi:DNA polymerase III subunit delta' [Sneathiella chinensis]|uniref:DNA polymerase III subunit delta n=1 Tax=Sneathiella chinensis TaxID=349750 RepID=A0ABQ5U774_9PROT|nr:DNA polymerase III subunit delta' [Sneathiella chinensis]GLQ07266.1 DNA polymerase III subunit delta' [Sneathiella chinensis]